MLLRLRVQPSVYFDGSLDYAYLMLLSSLIDGSQSRATNLHACQPCTGCNELYTCSGLFPTTVLD
jgi:hypothetical protein